MSRRTSLTRNEVLSVMRLMAEVASYRGLPQVQRELVAQWVGRHIGATSGAVFTGIHWRPRQTPLTLNIRLLDGGDEVFGRYIREVILASPGMTQQDPYVAPSLCSTKAVPMIDQRQVLGASDDLLRYGPYADWHSDAVMRDGMLCWGRLDELTPDTVAGLSLHRVEGDRPFNQRHRRTAILLMTELRRLALKRWYDMPELGLAHQPAFMQVASLSPRLRQVMDLLLAGRTDGDIARSMGLSVHTVRDYVKQVYRHFQVHSRGELMVMMAACDAADSSGDEPSP